MCPLTAPCSCGQIRILVEGPPRYVGLCHSLACPRRTGSAIATPAHFAGTYEVPSTAPDCRRTGDRGARFCFRVCPVCGANFVRNEDGVENRGVGVAVSAFHDPLAFPAPHYSVHNGRRIPGCRFRRSPLF